mgnify:CR=1 FL=1
MTNTVSDIVTDEELDSIIQIESGGNPKIKASTSSALGLGQFLNATWLAVVKKHRPDLLKGRSEARVLALRTDPTIAIELLARFTEDNRKIVGMNAAPGDLYLAHFLGAGTAQKVFAARGSTSLKSLVSAAAVSANRTVMLNKDGSYKTAGDLRAWAAKRMKESGGRGWVKKYYKPSAAPVALMDDSAGNQTDDDPPTVDNTEQKSAIDNPIAPKEGEGFLDWINRKRKLVAGWISGGGSGIGVLGYLTDWRVVAVLVGGLIIAGTIVGVFWMLRSRRRRK